MAYTGKNFEQNFEDSWKDQVTEVSLLRLYDTMNGYKTVANPCDYIIGAKEATIYLECKTTKDSSFPLANITENQFVSMNAVSLNTLYTAGGILVYFRERASGEDRLIYYPIEQVTRVKLSGRKSINPDTLTSIGREIKFTKKRVNIEVDCIDLINQLNDLYANGGEKLWQERDFLRQTLTDLEQT